MTKYDDEYEYDRPFPLWMFLIAAIPVAISIAMVGAIIWYFMVSTAAAADRLPAARPSEQVTLPCGPFAEIKAALEKQKQTELNVGFINDQSAVAVFASRAGERWTMLLLTADGNACIIGVGTEWMQGELETGEPV